MPPHREVDALAVIRTLRTHCDERMLSRLCAYLDLAPTAVEDNISRAQSEYIRVKQALWQVVLACFDDVT
jgi:hypothetical protein